MRTVLSCIAFVMLLSAPVRAASTTPVEAKVDKALAEQSQEKRIWVELDYYGLFDLEAIRPGFPLLTAQPTFFPNPNKTAFLFWITIDDAS